jgi:hypothetical protein
MRCARVRVSWGLSIGVGLLVACSGAAAQVLSIAERGFVDLGSSAVDQFGVPFTVTGLSGVAYVGVEGESHRFLAVMDNSDKLVELSVEFAGDGELVAASIVGGVRLAESRDFEGVVMTGRGSVLLSEEGTPSVREYRLQDGAFVGAWKTPPVFAARRANFGFESLTGSSGAVTVWTANEEALTVDGALATSSAGSVVRLLRFEDGVPGAQSAYVTEPIHGIAISGSRSGVSDMVVMPSGRVILLERSLALASPLFLTRIYEVDFAGATEVSGFAGLIGMSYTPVGKRLLYSGGQTNLEGLCLGPRMANGDWALVGVVDDADPVSVNRVVVFVMSGPVGCAADWDGSGVVNSQDFFAFLGAFFGGAAEFNGDGVTNTQDFFDFLSAFFSGC